VPSSSEVFNNCDVLENGEMNSKEICLQILDSAGIPLNSPEPWSIHVHDERLWGRVISQHQLGLAEGYMDGWWDCQAIDQMLTRLLEIDVLSLLKPSLSLAGHFLKSTLLNRQTKSRAVQNAKHHYNIGNDLYSRMLDSQMVYSCAYWSNAKDLEAAQQAKLDLICQKLYLEPGMRVLDIGSGWGGFLRHAVTNYGVTGVGISPAENQIELARQKSVGLPIEFLEQDYRDVAGQFDRIVSIGMMEHVGPKNLKTFFHKCDDLLTPDGLMLHHTISSNVTKLVTDPFSDRYIFPGGVLPSLAQISGAVENRWAIEDVHNFGPDYDKTLMAWHANITACWSEIPAYDNRFQRMWNYYLLSSAAGFRARSLQLFQVVFRRYDSHGVYVTSR
jgi:cyclopropane-fatty-acyl-phospholipid synthase